MRLSVFTKIFLVFLLVVSPLYLLSAFFYVWVRNQTRDEIYQTTLNNISLYISNVESGFERVINTSVRLINSHDLWDIGQLETLPMDHNVFTTLTRIQREVASLQRAFEYIQDVYILFPFSGIKVTAFDAWAEMTADDFARVSDTDFFTGFPLVNYAPTGGVYVNFSSMYHMEIHGQPPTEKIRWLIVTRIDTHSIAEDVYMFFADGFDNMAFVGEPSGLSIKTYVDEGLLAEIFAQNLISDEDMGIRSFQVNNRHMRVAYLRSQPLQSVFVLFVDDSDLLGVLDMYQPWFWVITATMCILLVVFTVLTRRVVAVPINRLIGAIKLGIAGDLNNSIAYEENEEFEYIYKQFNEMLKTHRHAIDKLYAQELTIKDTELKMLQYQINPHFLYNTFFTMYQLLQVKAYDDLQEIMFLLGKYFNFITKSASHIPLSEEIDFCNDYLKIQTIRFSSRIQADIDRLPEGVAGMFIPNLIIQPLLENCYKHGLKNKEEDGLIRLRFLVDAPFLTVCIEDNGDELTDADLTRIEQGLDQNEDSETLGIRNVNKRIKHYFGEAYGLEVSRSALGGLAVKVKLPV